MTKPTKDHDDDAAWRAFVIAERAAQGFGPHCTDEAINEVVALILGTGLPPQEREADA